MPRVDYEFLDFLGSGGFGSVQLARGRNDKKEYAVKIVKVKSLSEAERVMAKNEFLFLMNFECDYILKCHEMFCDESGNIYGILQKATTDLEKHLSTNWRQMFDFETNEYINPFNEYYFGFISKVLDNVFSALKYLHNEANVVHRDLKPANILIRKGKAKIADLGLAVKVDQNKLPTEIRGTPLYQSPEELAGNGYSFEIDIWAAGLIIFEILEPRHPFEHCQTYEELKKSIVGFKFPKINPIFGLSKEAFKYYFKLRQLAIKCLQRNPKERPTATECLKEIECICNE